MLTVGEKVASKEVPKAVLGFVLSTGTIRCGNSKGPAERTVGQDLAGATEDVGGGGGGGGGGATEVVDVFSVVGGGETAVVVVVMVVCF